MLVLTALALYVKDDLSSASMWPRLKSKRCNQFSFDVFQLYLKVVTFKCNCHFDSCHCQMCLMDYRGKSKEKIIINLTEELGIFKAKSHHNLEVSVTMTAVKI